jgi:amino acid adenylation domain-containing protein
VVVTRRERERIEEEMGRWEEEERVGVMEIEEVIGERGKGKREDGSEGEGEGREEGEEEEGRLAYVIYTSGTSGKPKGVMIEQGGMVNHLYAKIEELGLRGEDTVAETASASFDISVWQFLAVLMVGGRVHVVGEEKGREAGRLIEEVEAEQVSVLEVVPGMLGAITEEETRRGGGEGRKIGNLRMVVVTGEAVSGEACRRMMGVTRGIELVNAYGPTECSDDVTHERVEKEEIERREIVAIGRVLRNQRVYIEDERGRAVGIGVEGELKVGGAGVGRGYYKWSEQTARQYEPEEGGGRKYATGDRARYRRDGRIEYLGRKDEQVKVRGYRIEKMEIEGELEKEEGVERAVVEVKEMGGGEKVLVGYLEVREGGGVRVKEVERRLSERLPEYMVPRVYVEMERIPLTANGKVDRRKLPEPELSIPDDSETPRDAVELHLFEIWSDVLKTRRFGIRNNFFALGGHSLAAVSLSSRVSDLYGRKMPVRAVFDFPTIEQMAFHLRQESDFALPSSVIPIQPQGARPPFFCVHGASGFAGIYIPLARCLGKDQPFYGLQALGLEEGQTPVTTIEEMAERYLADMRRIQPVGPYQIGGWSLGGTIAYEMTQRLLTAGEEVSLLAIFDNAPKFNDVEDRPLNEELLELKERQLLHRYFDLGVPDDALRTMPIPDMLRLIILRRTEAENQVLQTEEEYLRLIRTWVTNEHAASRYKPRPLAGRVTLFRRNSSSAPEHDYGWGALVSGGVDVHYFDVDHESFVLDPNAPALADELSKYLAQVK